MAEIFKKSFSSQALKSNMETASSRNLESFLLIETEYIKNLQKQVYLLELEVSFLRKQARKATSNQPRLTAEADQMITEMKSLQSQINIMQVELSMKETSMCAVRGEVEALRRHLQDVSDSNIREKRVLVEDVIQLKKLADVSTQDLAHKEEEQKTILPELHSTMHRIKEKDRDLLLLQKQLQAQKTQHEAVEAQLAEKRSECLTIQAATHQLEEQYVATAQSVQERIVTELRKEAEKLRYQLKEKQMAADEDKYLRNKLAEDSGRLTKTNGHLQSRVLEATKQLNEEQQLREKESLNRAKRVSELTLGSENKRHLELTLSHWRRLVQDEKEKVAAAQEQVLQLQQGRKSVEMSGSSLHKQLTDLQNKHSKVHQENSLLRVEKNHLVEHISQLHKQIAEKNDEIRRMQGHVDSLCCDMDSLKLCRDLGDSTEDGTWQRLSGITHNVYKLAADMTLD
ncbi:CAP-Gly domain-containing linker protein 1-like isoform X1 [Pseudophryne corroboree]|uniref:CAP-Gly domain-containing linker protein 1-like isoform X1 n=1 Tax=Pseudophryne corroboree TaxID=495146 RepID=UPI003081F562